MMTRPALAPTVVLDEGTDVEAAVRYYRGDRTPDEIRRILGRRGPVDLAELLPPFARARLDTFPPLDGPQPECMWTALHFFDREPPDEAAVSEPELRRILARDYGPVPYAERRFGDVIALARADGVVVHVVNQIADDVVFTKNGADPRIPWRLLRMADVEWRYRAATVRSVHRLRRPARG